MITIITCTGCHKEGGLPVELEIEYRTDHCRSCGNSDRKTWKYWFCSTACMLKWLADNKVAEVGLPCRDCFSWDTGTSTGYAHGFQQNGVCTTCSGKKTVKIK